MRLPEVVVDWLAVVIFSTAFTLGYYSYVAVKRRFDSIYDEKSLFAKRAIHGVVYLIFLVLLNEGIRVKSYVLGPYRSVLGFFLNIVFIMMGIPIFLDIVLSVYKGIKGKT